MRNSKSTVRDVAKLAGVAVSTVSETFNDGPVSASTREKVLNAAKMLGYVRNGIARSMVTKRTQMLGLILPWNNVEIVDSAVRRAHELGYGLMTLFSDGAAGTSEAELVRRMVERMVDGIIFAPKMLSDANYPEIISMITAAKAELVLIDRCFSEMKCDAFVTDDYAGGASAMEHLASLGHRKALFMTNFDESSAMRNRRRGAMDSARRLGIECYRESTIRVSNADEVLAALRNLFVERDGERPTAIFAGTDHVAYDAIIACGKLGLKIPEDISIVSYGDLLLGPHRIGELLSPPLTAVRQNLSLIAKLAVDKLLEKLSSDEPEAETEEVRIDTELVVRKSTAPPPRASSKRCRSGESYYFE